MKHVKTAIISAVLYFSAMPAALAQLGGIGSDEVTATLDRTVSWLQLVAIGVLSIYVIFNFMRMGKDDEEGPRAKKHVGTGLAAIAGVMLLKGLIHIVQQLTASSISVGY